MSDVLFFLLSPGAAIIFFAASALWLWWRPGSRYARRFLLSAACLYTFASTYVFPAAVARLATRGFHRFEPGDLPPGGNVAVVLLGSGSDTIVGWEDRVPIMTSMQASRVIETSRVVRTIGPQWIVSSGGSPVDPRLETPSGLAMRDELVRMGVPKERILIETVSLTTHDQAVILVPMLKARGVERVVLVTSDVHMRRSLGAFRALGLSAVPAIAPDPGYAGTWLEWLTPGAHSLSYSSVIVHELLGLPYYWIRGWWLAES